jgi:hypothetical protein
MCQRRPTGHPLDSLNRAHLVARSQSGDDVESNIVPLCGSGTTGCHGKLHSADAEAAKLLRSRLRDEEVEYVIGRKGEAWLDRIYPPTKLVNDEPW